MEEEIQPVVKRRRGFSFEKILSDTNDIDRLLFRWCERDNPPFLQSCEQKDANGIMFRDALLSKKVQQKLKITVIESNNIDPIRNPHLNPNVDAFYYNRFNKMVLDYFIKEKNHVLATKPYHVTFIIILLFEILDNHFAYYTEYAEFLYRQKHMMKGLKENEYILRYITKKPMFKYGIDEIIQIDIMNWEYFLYILVQKKSWDYINKLYKRGKITYNSQDRYGNTLAMNTIWYESNANIASWYFYNKFFIANSNFTLLNNEGHSIIYFILHRDFTNDLKSRMFLVIRNKLKSLAWTDTKGIAKDYAAMIQWIKMNIPDFNDEAVSRVILDSVSSNNR